MSYRRSNQVKNVTQQYLTKVRAEPKGSLVQSSIRIAEDVGPVRRLNLGPTADL